MQREETYENLRYYPVNKYSWMPYTIRIILESITRNVDNKSITEEDLNTILHWDPSKPQEVPFKVARIIVQDYTGVPALVDLALMRELASSYGLEPDVINPLVPVDLVIDHSIQVDYWNAKDAFLQNLKLELERNKERYQFFKWAEKSFNNFRLFPPGSGIIHQVNLEYIAKVVMLDRYAYFDTVLGMDSHTTMINALGVLGWGVGGIEAEAAMLGQPVTIIPSVIGVKLYNKPREGVTATDIVLTLTERLRREGVVGKFIEYFGEVDALTVPDRATISNMAPEYGATAALFPVDDQTIKYLKLTGRSEEHIALVKAYLRLQNMYGSPKDVHYSKIIEFDLDEVEPVVAGPILPWQKRNFSEAKSAMNEMILNKKGKKVTLNIDGEEFGDGSVAIAAITSCTNTSNPSLIIAAGLVAKKAYDLGIKVPQYVKTSLAPGSRVVEEYLRKAELLEYLEEQGFSIVGYGCTTCIGNSGPLKEEISKTIRDNNLIVASVLSGNRNFEGRIHPDIKANFLMSPPLVIAYALAGEIKDLNNEPIGYNANKAVYLKDIWPSNEEVNELLSVISPEDFRRRYENLEDMVPGWKAIDATPNKLYQWDDNDTYIKRPTFMDDFSLNDMPSNDILNARTLLILGDNITTDHISPAGPIKPDSEAGTYLQNFGVNIARLNTFGARRGNWEVMVRGTFTGKYKNKMLKDASKTGYTIHYPSKEVVSIYEAARRYKRDGVPMIVIAGKNYGAGSSRDWAAKGPKLLGIKAVIAESFERIHRSNLVCMGILPLEFIDTNVDALGLDGSEVFDIIGLEELEPNKIVELVIHKDDNIKRVKLKVRIDTAIELRYYLSAGILNYVLKNIIKGSRV